MIVKLLLKILLWAVAAFLAVVLVLLVFGGAILRGPLERLASAQLERDVKIGRLDLNVITLTPGVHVSDLKVANAVWVNGKDGVSAPPMIDMGDLNVALRLLPLFTGKVVLAELGIENSSVSLLRETGGRANWAFGSSKKAEEPVSGATPLALPVIEHLYVKNSRLELKDALSKITFDGGFVTEESNSRTGTPFSLSGKGMLNKQPFVLELQGGALASAIANQTYPFHLDIKHGATRITAKGQFIRPLDFGDFTAAMTLSGRNLADLYYLTGLALPATRAYDLKGELNRNGAVYTLDKLAGKLGASDLSGKLSVDTAGKRPMLTADLQSRLLDPADAGVVFGGATNDAGEVVAPRFILPDSPLELARLRGMDARVTYKATAVNVDSLPLKQVDLTLALDAGKLTISPLAVTLPQGTVSGSLVIDGSKDVPAMDIDVKLSGARLEDFMAKAGQPNAIEGPIVARVKMAGVGNSFHKAASTANGTAAVVIPHGQIRQAFAELLGINAARGLGLLLTGDQKQIGLRCGIASFEAKDGLMTGQHIVFDTETVVAVGSGTINLADESLDLSLRGKPKEIRIGRLLTPIKVGGTLSDPSLGVGITELGVQAGVATAIGAVLNPLAAIIPFLDAGLAEDANCGALMRDARDAGVKTGK